MKDINLHNDNIEINNKEVYRYLRNRILILIKLVYDNVHDFKKADRLFTKDGTALNMLKKSIQGGHKRALEEPEPIPLDPEPTTPRVVRKILTRMKSQDTPIALQPQNPYEINEIYLGITNLILNDIIGNIDFENTIEQLYDNSFLPDNESSSDIYNFFEKIKSLHEKTYKEKIEGLDVYDMDIEGLEVDNMDIEDLDAYAKHIRNKIIFVEIFQNDKFINELCKIYYEDYYIKQIGGDEDDMSDDVKLKDFELGDVFQEKIISFYEKLIIFRNNIDKEFTTFLNDSLLINDVGKLKESINNIYEIYKQSDISLILSVTEDVSFKKEFNIIKKELAFINRNLTNHFDLDKNTGDFKEFANMVTREPSEKAKTNAMQNYKDFDILLWNRITNIINLLVEKPSKKKGLKIDINDTKNINNVQILMMKEGMQWFKNDTILETLPEPSTDNIELNAIIEIYNLINEELEKLSLLFNIKGLGINDKKLFDRFLYILEKPEYKKILHDKNIKLSKEDKKLYIDDSDKYIKAENDLEKLKLYIETLNDETSNKKYIINNAGNLNELSVSLFGKDDKALLPNKKYCPISSIIDSASIQHQGCDNNNKTIIEYGNIDLRFNYSDDNYFNIIMTPNKEAKTARLTLKSNLPNPNMINESFEMDLNDPKSSVKSVYLDMIKELVSSITSYMKEKPNEDTIWSYISNIKRDKVVKILALSYKKTAGDWLQEINGSLSDFGYENFITDDNKDIFYKTEDRKNSERLFFATDQPSIMHWMFMRIFLPDEYINKSAYGGYIYANHGKKDDNKKYITYKLLLPYKETDGTSYAKKQKIGGKKTRHKKRPNHKTHINRKNKITNKNKKIKKTIKHKKNPKFTRKKQLKLKKVKYSLKNKNKKNINISLKKLQIKD